MFVLYIPVEILLKLQNTTTAIIIAVFETNLEIYITSHSIKHLLQIYT